MKEDEDCEAENSPEYLGYPCISKDITSNWCKQPMDEEEINVSRMEDDTQSNSTPDVDTRGNERLQKADC